MQVDLVRTTTADGMRLDGVWQDAERPTQSETGPQALLCLHGVGSNFYGATLMEELGEALVPLGVGLLRVNTRGHDGMTVAQTRHGPSRQGAAYEVVDECRLDIAAWIEFLLARGVRRIGLLGHSLGAIKAVYSQAYEPHSAVDCVLAISPPQLSYQAFCEGPRGELFRAAMDEAEQLVAAGQGRQLIEIRVPFPLVITAAGYVEKYGPEQRYDLLRFAERVRSPTLYVYGQEELESGNEAFAGLPEKIAALPGRHAPWPTRVVAGADHMYRGRRAELGKVLLEWLAERAGKT